ncbi:MAG TPA: secretin N-terminal domain-containing protein [Candidatus Omnitrophota bacterium]|nr:secretin N-terminal domain-containing protein [Candidatus Omnitrophota bacterium]
MGNPKSEIRNPNLKGLAAIALAAVFITSLCLMAGAATAAKGVEPVKVSGGTLTFKLKDADIKSVLEIFAKQLGVNIVSGDDVTGKVSFSFTNVRPREGLEAVLRAKGFDWFQEGDTLVVTAKNTVRTYLLEYASADEVKGALDLLAEPGDSISVSSSYNALIVKASTKNIARIEKAIRDLDVPPIQVMVEAKIVEVRYNDNGAAGLNSKYNYKGSLTTFAETLGMAGDPTATGAQGLYAQIISGNATEFLSAMLQKTDYNLIASPRITTINHKQAVILIGSQLGYQSAVITTTGTVYQVNFLTTGTQLTITPHVGENGFIRMKIYPKVSDGNIVSGLPNENTTETQNEVLVKDGQTVIIGGLTKEDETQTDTGIPILMQIPILGAFFRRTEIVNEKRELLVFVTPHILTPQYLDQMTAEAESTTKRAHEGSATFIH